ncbi:hypothetical protein TB2_013228 [Malus domestica]
MDGGAKSGRRRLSDSDIRPSNIGVLNLEDETNTQHYSPNVSPALWIMPLFNGLCYLLLNSFKFPKAPKTNLCFCHFGLCNL